MTMEKQSSKTHYELIGAIATAWAGLEFEMDNVLWALVGGHQHRLACLTAQMFSIHARLNAFASICHQRGLSKETLKKIGSFMGTTGALAEARNRAVHDPLVRLGDEPDIYRITITAKGTPQFGPVVQSPDNLRSTLKRIMVCKAQFSDLTKIIVAELRAQPEETPTSHDQLFPLR